VIKCEKNRESLEDDKSIGLTAISITLKAASIEIPHPRRPHIKLTFFVEEEICKHSLASNYFIGCKQEATAIPTLATVSWHPILYGDDYWWSARQHFKM